MNEEKNDMSDQFGIGWMKKGFRSVWSLGGKQITAAGSHWGDSLLITWMKVGRCHENMKYENLKI